MFVLLSRLHLRKFIIFVVDLRNQNPCGSQTCNPDFFKGFSFLGVFNSIGNGDIKPIQWDVAYRHLESKEESQATTEADTPKATLQTYDRGDTWGLVMTASPVKQIRRSDRTNLSFSCFKHAEPVSK
jgi:hypothetical protein